MADTRSGAHALHVARLDDRAGADRVAVLERAVEDIGNDLHIGMAMGREARPGDHLVLIDHPQRTEAHMGRVVILPEGKAVLGIEPVDLARSTILRTPDGQHVCLLVSFVEADMRL